MFVMVTKDNILPFTNKNNIMESTTISIITLIVAFFTLVSQIKTQKNTIPTMSKKSQKMEFKILVRFLLKNFAQSIAIWLLLEKDEYKEYPSEVYIEEQTINIENLNLHLFYKDKDIAPSISQLLFLLNNYNHSMKVVFQHLADNSIPKETKSEEIQKLLIVRVFDLLLEINSFMQKAYKRNSLCKDEIIDFFKQWENSEKIMKAFGLTAGSSIEKFKLDNEESLKTIGFAVDNPEFRNYLLELGVAKKEITSLLNNIVPNIAAYCLGNNPSYKIMMIPHT